GRAGGTPKGGPACPAFRAGGAAPGRPGAFRAVGVWADRLAEPSWVVQGRGLHGRGAPSGVLDMGNAGTAIRLSMGLLSGQRCETTMTGDASLRARPMERVAAPLRLMGANIETTGGRPPVTVRPAARLIGVDYQMPMASAQVKSAILLAGLYAEGRTSVTEPAPTRDHTERMLRGFGLDVRTECARASLQGGAKLQGARIAVPGDISSAAFFLVAGCLAGADDFVVENVGINPTRTGIL